MQHYLVRVGALAEVRVAESLASLDHGQRVVLQSPRGLELGVVCGTDSSGCLQESQRLAEVAPGYKVLRPTNESDELLIKRLEHHKREAVEHCRQQLADAGSNATLLDVDQMLSGGALVLHFLGEVDETAEKISTQIAKQYEEVVRTEHFAELLRDGCGPDCGTSGGCSSGGCSGCGVAAACHG